MSPESTDDESDDGDTDESDGAEGEGSSAEESTDEPDEDGTGNGAGSEPEDTDEEADSTGTGDGTEESADESDEDFKGKGPEEYEDLEYGEPDECEDGFQKFGRHEPDGDVATNDTEADRKEVERAIAQGEYFDTPSVNIWGVNIHTDVTEGAAWVGDGYYSRRVRCQPIEIPETILTPASTRLRIVFADNQRGAMESNLKRGRVNGRVLGRRVATSDPRLFEREDPAREKGLVRPGRDGRIG